MVARLLTGILGIVFTSLGLTFTILGLVLDGQSTFAIIGGPLLVAGLASLGVCVVLFKRAGAAGKRRTSRAEAEVVDVVLHPGIRVGVYLTIDLTVRIPSVPGGPFTARVLIPPTMSLGPGDKVELLYDPGDPSNFETAAVAEKRLR
jgi:hypothetical protein